jgi:hypothetical protein
MAAGNSSFGVLATTTLRNARQTLFDNLSNHSPLLAKLRAHGGVRKDRGGTTITEPLLYGGNSTVKPYAGYEPLDLTPQEGLTSAEFEWKQLAGSVVISGMEKFKNSQGKTQIVNLLKAKLKQLDISFKEEVNRQILSDGTGFSSKSIGGLGLLVGIGGGDTVGGIDASDAANAWWDPQIADFDTVYSGAGNFTSANGATFSGLMALRDMYTSVLRGDDRVGLIISTDACVNAYEAIAEGDKLRVTDTGLADLGFDNVAFKGVPMVWDAFMDADDTTNSPYAGSNTTGHGPSDDEHRIYFLNLNYLNFVIGEGKEFMTTPFMRPENQDAEVANVILYCNMTVSNRARQGVIYSATAWD